MKSIIRQLLFFIFGIICLKIHAVEKPNILLFTADDLYVKSPGCYGGEGDLTPNLDLFAKSGMLFENAYVNCPLCVPSRACIATGLYPYNSGVDRMVKADLKTPTLAKLFSQAGYCTGVIGKVRHSSACENDAWSYASLKYGESDEHKTDFSSLGYPEVYYNDCKQFLQKCRNEKKRFFLMVNCHDPHRPFINPNRPETVGKEPSKIYKPEDVKIPGFLPQLPGIRREISYYSNCVRRMDDTFGMILKSLKEAGLADQTIVIFLSDNGISIPFAKGNLYPAGVQTPLIIRWPGVTPEYKTDTDHLISTVDLMPTLLEASGIKPPAMQDGLSFLPLLEEKPLKQQKDHVFCQVDWNPSCRDWAMRSIYTKEFCYISNLWSNGKTTFSIANNEGETLALMQKAAETDPKVKARVDFYHYRVPEELYDLKKDPHCLINLASNKKYEKILDQMRQKLNSHRKQPLQSTKQKAPPQSSEETANWKRD